MTELNITRQGPIWQRDREHVGLAGVGALLPRRAGDGAGWPIMNADCRSCSQEGKSSANEPPGWRRDVAQ